MYSLIFSGQRTDLTSQTALPVLYRGHLSWKYLDFEKQKEVINQIPNRGFRTKYNRPSVFLKSITIEDQLTALSSEHGGLIQDSPFPELSIPASSSNISSSRDQWRDGMSLHTAHKATQQHCTGLHCRIALLSSNISAVQQ